MVEWGGCGITSNLFIVRIRNSAFRNLSTDNAGSFIICVLNMKEILSIWIKTVWASWRGDNNLYRHKYASPSTLIVIFFTCILKTENKSLIFQTSFSDGDDAGVDSLA